MIFDAHNAKGIEPQQPDLDRTEAIKTTAELAGYFASADRRSYDAPSALSQ